MKKFLLTLYEEGLNLIFPRRCPVCDGVVAPYMVAKGRLRAGQLIHPKCRKQVKYVTGPLCLKCGKPLGKQGEYAEYCEDCKKTRHYFTGGFSVFEYRSMASSIYRFKYRGRQEYATFYAAETARKLGRKVRTLGIEAIIPVPMYEKKKISRGYNQAEILAREISKKIGIREYENIIKRIQNTRPMKELDARGRRNNLKKAFNITRNDVKFKCILIIDDIYTTGSTIDEIAHEFLMAGVEKVYFLTLSIGQTT